MQQGANSATPPAKNAARTPPVVRRSPTGAHLGKGSGASAIKERLELAAGQPACGEVAAVDNHQGVHRRSVFSKESQAGRGGRFDVFELDRRTRGLELAEHVLCVIAEVATRRGNQGDAS